MGRGKGKGEGGTYAFEISGPLSFRFSASSVVFVWTSLGVQNLR